jgi:hypothetical protein
MYNATPIFKNNEEVTVKAVWTDNPPVLLNVLFPDLYKIESSIWDENYESWLYNLAGITERFFLESDLQTNKT